MFRTRPRSTGAKGAMKCFQCRKSIPAREGSWHIRGSQQVFLCKGCDKPVKIPGKKAASFAVTMFGTLG